MGFKVPGSNALSAGTLQCGILWRKRHRAGSARLPVESGRSGLIHRCLSSHYPGVVGGQASSSAQAGCVAFLERSILKFTFVLLAGTNPRLPRGVVGWEQNDGESTLIGRGYFVRQAATLLKFAQTTTDPKVAAGLVDKAADLRSQVDETSALPDLGARAPDVEPPAAS